MPRSIFTDETVKANFEQLFTTAVGFAYFPNFSRVRVEFEDSLNACRARIRFHLFDFMDAKLRVFLTNHITRKTIFRQKSVLSYSRNALLDSAKITIMAVCSRNMASLTKF